MLAELEDMPTEDAVDTLLRCAELPFPDLPTCIVGGRWAIGGALGGKGCTWT